MEWKPFTLSEIADIGSGRDIYEAERIEGDTPYVTAGTRNNGIGYFVGNTNDTLTSDVIVLNRNGAVGNAFYHPYRVLVGNDCRTVRLHEEVDADCKRFVASTISEQRACFSYSRKLGTARAQKMRIMLPVDGTGDPDWDYMDGYVASKRAKLLARYREYIVERVAELDYSDVPALDEMTWGRCKVFEDGYLNIATTNSSIDGIRLIDGNDMTVPYVTRSDKNNGIARFVSSSNFEFGSDEGGCITVGLDTQTAFWQPLKFVTGQNIQVITGDVLNDCVAMFLIPLLVTQMRAKFNWGGNGATLGRMKKLEMLLPIDDKGEPDWAYMEQYAMNMMLKKYKQYLSYLKTNDGNTLDPH